MTSKLYFKSPPPKHYPDFRMALPDDGRFQASQINSTKDTLTSVALHVPGSGHCFEKAWNSIVEFFKSCFGNTQPYSSTGPSVIQPSQYSHKITNPNKQFVYNQLVQGRSVGDQITVRKRGINPHSLEKEILFTPTKPQITSVNGCFTYEASTADTVHWTANFADKNLFGYCGGPLLAQDELQVLEHPALAHVKNGLPSNMRTLEPTDAVLLQNVPRLGALDTGTPLPNGHTLYGNYFAAASQGEILSRLTRFDHPVSSNIFAIEAPHVSPALKNQPVQRKDFARLFFAFYNAAYSIKAICGQKVVMHSGNWGTGAYGNDHKTSYLMQLAAARFARTDELRMYPLGFQNEFEAAKQLLDQIERKYPNMTIGGFLDHLAENAAHYGLRYKVGNGT